MTNNYKTAPQEDSNPSRQTKEIITSLHLSLQQNDETILRLQNELRVKDDVCKKRVQTLERDIEGLKDENNRLKSKQHMEQML